LFSSGGRNRTYGLLIQSQASLPTGTTPEWITLQSALRELNPPRQLGRLEPLPLGQGHSGRGESRTHKAYRSTVFETAAIAIWLALPLRAAEAGIEPAGYAFNRRAHATNSSPSAIESAQLDLNQRSPASGAGGIARLSHTPMQERPAGVEPAHPPWQGSRLPLHHGRLLRSYFNCQRANRAPGRTRTGVAALRVRNLGR
jgi:hypothetical protein